MVEALDGYVIDIESYHIYVEAARDYLQVGRGNQESKGSWNSLVNARRNPGGSATPAAGMRAGRRSHHNGLSQANYLATVRIGNF